MLPLLERMRPSFRGLPSSLGGFSDFALFSLPIKSGVCGEQWYILFLISRGQLHETVLSGSGYCGPQNGRPPSTDVPSFQPEVGRNVASHASSA